jgi:hypothetical protein
MSGFAGAVILQDSKKTLLFKNRDMILQDPKDDFFYNENCFGICGVDEQTGRREGLAIGVNSRGLAITNTHVRSTSDGSYLKLAEQLLALGKDAEDCLGIAVEQLKRGNTYQWSNMILADYDSMLVIELAGTNHSMEWSERRALRTNHHIMLDTEPFLRGDGIDYDSSVERVERGYELARKASEVQDVFSILKDHGNSPGKSSLCRHAEGDDQNSTVMSYLIEIDNSLGSDNPKIMFHFARGKPCENAYTSVPILFPADEETTAKITQTIRGEQ